MLAKIKMSQKMKIRTIALQRRENRLSLVESRRILYQNMKMSQVKERKVKKSKEKRHKVKNEKLLKKKMMI